MTPNLGTQAPEQKKLTRAERFDRWLAEKQMALMPRFPRRFYGQNVVVRVATRVRGLTYKPNGAKECARRRKQMHGEGI